ncbi:hypothetical protein BLNAU_16863 [Blattamonas nauphoetae]|uniref:Uncharacterized protein n=1 Tax=Blattamonas nauphoetae TaxID=2049346 RepID=A0ABQ9X980_9EUKA|nr:hypothetical protein BLNAU_16863 [Blattamonas nauphoetae]
MLNVINSPYHFEAQTTIERELLIGNRLSLVENSLFGTVTSVLGSSRDFLALNTTLLNCVNSEVTEGTIFTSESETYNFTTSPIQIAKQPTISTHLFNNCTFTGDRLSIAFTVILFSNYSGRLTFNSTTFDFVRRNDKSLTLLNFGGDVDAFPTLTFDRSSVLFSRDGNGISGTQIVVNQSVNAFYVSSNFTHHPSATRTGSRLAYTTVGCDFHTFSGCRVIGQSTDANGGVLAYSGANPLLSCFDSLFESNSAKGAGGCFTSYTTYTHAQRCIFRGNTADSRGGAMFFDYGIYFRFEDTHFEGNKAFMCYPSSSQLAHYRGNDINLHDSKLSVLTTAGAMVGCTSSSKAPKLGYYTGSVTNGNLTNEDDYLPTPSESLPKAAGVWEVAEGGAGDCSASSPCATIAAALVKISTSASKTKFNTILVERGEFSLSHDNIPMSFEIVGLGWARDTSTFTTIMSEGISLSENSNTTFRALTLLPSSKSVTSITMMSPTTLYLTDVKADRLSEQTKSLFVFGAGKINFHQCQFDEVSLADCPLISITGSATVSMVHVWFSRIVRTVGRGASCVDSSTTSTLSITTSDCGACSSVGRAGCFDLSTTNLSASLSIGVYFSKNTANTGNDPSITQTANDLFISGYSTSKISIGSSRSISSPNHVIQNGNAVTLIYPSRGFNDFGMNHPISTRFDRATPMSEFGTLNLYVHNLPESSTEVTANIYTKNPLVLEPLDYSKKKVAVRFCPLKTKDQNQSPFFTVGEKASLKLFQTPTTVNIALSVPLVVLTTATSSFTSYIVTYDIIDLTHTSPFFRAEQGTLIFTSTSFSRGVKLSGCAFIHSTGSEVKFDTSKFSDFTSTSNGSVLHSSGASIVATKSTFTSCSAKHGGVFFVALSGSNSVTLIHDKSSAYPVTFSNCSAVGEAGGPDNARGLGGVIYVKGTSSAANPIRCSTTVSDDARFEGNMALEGSDMFIEKELFDGKTTESLVNFGGGSYSEDFRIVIEGRTGTPGEMEMVQTQLMVQPKVSVNGSEVELTTGKSGNDDENCKWTSSICETLAFGIKFLNQTYQNGKPIPQNIQFVWNMTYTEKEIVVTNQIVTLTGTTTSNKNTAKLLRSQLKIDESLAVGACLFTITNTASLTVKNLDICAIATAGLFELRDDADSLELNDVGILCQVDLPHEYCLIKSTKGPVTLVGCCFDRMKGSNDLPILNAPLVSFSSTEASLSISTTTFNSFSVSTTPLIAVVTEHELTFRSNTFNINVVLQTATLVRVTSSSLNTVVTPSLWTGSFTQSQRLLDFVGCDSSLTSDHQFFESSLLFYLLPPTVNIVAGHTTDNEESEHPNCGTDRLRCSSLSSALASALTHSLSASIFVDINSEFHVDIRQADDLSVSWRLDRVEWSWTIVVIHLTRLRSFTDKHSLHTCHGQHRLALSLTTCSIGTDIVTEMNTFMTTLLDVANGCSLSLSGTEFKNLKFTHSSLGTAIVLRLGSSFSSDSGLLFSSVSSNATGSLIFVHSANLETTSKATPFSLIKTTFEPLPARLMTIDEKKWYAGEVGNKGAETLFDISGTLRVDSVNFRKLKTSQSAGLFKLELTDTETLCFTTTQIELCSSTGAPFLSLVLSSTTLQTNWDFNLKGISFTEESSNSVPSAAIDPETDENKFWGIDSTTSVESSLLVYLVEPGNEIDVDGKKGRDIAHCGHFGVACQTIGRGFVERMLLTL